MKIPAPPDWIGRRRLVYEWDDDRPEDGVVGFYWFIFESHDPIKIWIVYPEGDAWIEHRSLSPEEADEITLKIRNGDPKENGFL